MRIQHRMVYQPSCRVPAVTLWGVREGKGEQEEDRRMKTEKMLRGETKVALN